MRRIYFAVVLLVASLFGVADCDGSRKHVAGVEQSAPKCSEGSSDTYFFPKGIFSKDRADIDEFVRCWYSLQLTAMGEPSLSRNAFADEISYRFLWLRTFHPPIAIRISLSGDRAQLTAVQLSGAGGYEPGTVVRRQSLTLTSQEWSRFNDALNSARFWTAPTTVEHSGLDSAEWVIEGRRQNTYHVIDRWSPKPDDDFYKIGLLFLELTDWSSSVEPVY
jgi:hypothetical protein